MSETMATHPAQRWKPYPKYKDSGVEWLGEVPEHWEVKRLKFLASVKTGNTPSKSESDNYSSEGVPWVKPDDLGSFHPITESAEYLSEKGAQVARLIERNSVLVCCIGTVGKVGVAGCTLSTNQQINSVSTVPTFPLIIPGNPLTV